VILIKDLKLHKISNRQEISTHLVVFTGATAISTCEANNLNIATHLWVIVEVLLRWQPKREVLKLPNRRRLMSSVCVYLAFIAVAAGCWVVMEGRGWVGGWVGTVMFSSMRLDTVSKMQNRISELNVYK
jgi:hypothetical protein